MNTKELIEKYKPEILNKLAFYYKTSFFTIMNNSKEELTRTKANPAHIRVLHGAIPNGNKSNIDEVKEAGFDESFKFPKLNAYVYVTSNGFDGNYCESTKANHIPLTLREEVYDSDCDKLFIRKNKNGKVLFGLFTASELRKFNHSYFTNDKLQTCVTIDIDDMGKFTAENGFKYRYKDSDPNKVLENFKPEYLGSCRYTNKQFRGDKVIVITDENDNVLKVDGEPLVLHFGSWRDATRELNRRFFVPMGLKEMCETKLHYIYEKKHYNRFVIENNDKERRFYMTDHYKSIEEIIKENALLRKEGSKDIIIKKDGKIKAKVHETLRTRNWVCVDKYEKEWELTYDDFTKQQICVNKPLDLNHPNRKIDGVHKQNYLFECDNISLEDQVNLINNELPKEVQDSILWANYSGSKSIHVVIATNTPDDVTRDERKYIHHWLNSVYFNMKADPSGQNANRLARTPNAMRDNGRIQKAFYINDDKAIPFDVMPFLEPYRQQKKELEMKLRERRIASENMSTCTLAALKSWNTRKPSKAKQECIDCLEGRLTDWNRTAAVVRTLSNWGWSAGDILSEGPYNDTWIKSAIRILKFSTN